MNNKSPHQSSQEHLMDTYNRLPISFVRGEGMTLFDQAGTKYLDALGGIAVCVLGHNHPQITKTIQEQAAKLLHTSNLYEIENQSLLATLLARLTGLDQSFFCNSGAEAVETALKLIRLYGHEKGFAFPKVIVMERAFHGRTFATISAGGSPKVQAGFDPLVPGFIRAPYNNIEALVVLAKEHKDIAAILVEPIQGEGGIFVPDSDYLQKIRELCDRQGWLMVLDEIQTGMGRTGALFNYQLKQVLPDMVTIAKGLANGIPIGACVAKKSIGSLFKTGSHGSTFGGNPLATATAISTLDIIESQKLWENAKLMGELLKKELQIKLKNEPGVIDIRGEGLMLGIELDRPCREILNLALTKQLLFNITQEKVIRLLPPLIISQKEVEEIVRILPELIRTFIKQTTASNERNISKAP